MKTPVCIIERYEYIESLETFSTTANVITNIESVRVSYGYQDKKDTFTISLIPTKKYNPVSGLDVYDFPTITSNDLIRIYTYFEDDPLIVWDAVNTWEVTNLEDFLLFDAVVDKTSMKSDKGVLSMSVSGNNRTELLLNNLVPAQYKLDTVPDMLTDIAVKLRNNNRTKPLFMFKDYKGDGTDVGGSAPQAYDYDGNNKYGLELDGYEKWGIVPRGRIRAYKSAAYELDEVNGYYKLKEFEEDGVTPIDLEVLTEDGFLKYRFKQQTYYETWKSLYTHFS